MLAKRLGLFRVARRIYRRRLRILCYHGFETADQAAFKPKLFMRGDTFERRLATLAQEEYRVVELGAALAGLREGTNPDDCVAITIDDGWSGVKAVGAPLLKRFGYPATLYVSTQYVVERYPVFDVAVEYLFWKAAARPGSGGAEPLEHTVDDVCARGSQVTVQERFQLWRDLGQRMGLDTEAIAQSGALNLMTAADIRLLANQGMDIQLHTHRHDFPLGSATDAKAEIAMNRAVLEPLVGHPLRHFCYPSGVWSEAQGPWLEELGVESATTCEAGLNHRETPRYALNRFLDGENIEQIEFEAEVSGFLELLRAGRRFAGRR